MNGILCATTQEYLSASQDSRVDCGFGDCWFFESRRQGQPQKLRAFESHKTSIPSGKPGDDAKKYQERAVKLAIEESKK
jgi:hypothetical protein